MRHTVLSVSAMTQPKLRKVGIAAIIIVMSVVSYGLGTLDAPASDTARAERSGFEEGTREAGRRYDDGVAAGRNAYRPGASEYERIYEAGVAAGREKAKATASAAYDKRVAAAQADVEERYDDGHIDATTRATKRATTRVSLASRSMIPTTTLRPTFRATTTSSPATHTARTVLTSLMTLTASTSTVRSL